MNSKIVLSSNLKRIIQKLKKTGKVIVFTNGCFDILHAGHVDYLQKAKKLGDVLVIALNTDTSVRKLKGKNRPIVSEKDRAKVLAALECVDYVTFFDELTPFEIIKNLKPDILVKGADYKHKEIVGRDTVLSYGGKVKTVSLIKGKSTTLLIEKIKNEK